MIIKAAAEACRPFIDKCDIPEKNPEFGKDHLHEMIDKIMSNKVTGEKSHRWLGYLQGVIVSNGGATLEEMKQINFKN